MYIYGDNLGMYDYSPVLKIGTTDCKVTMWQSNTAVQCVTAPATTFLAGENLELPLKVCTHVRIFVCVDFFLAGENLEFFGGREFRAAFEGMHWCTHLCVCV
jgi:hypothetical protein